VTLNRPDRRNALDRATVDELGRVGRALAADETVRGVVLTGSGDRAFCAGADLKEREGMSDDDVRAMLDAAPHGVVYLWSPHMPLSVDGYRTVSEVARRMGMSFTAVLDPMSDAAYAAAVAAEAGLPKSALRTFSSIELSFRQLNLHAPAVLVFSGGHFDGLAVPGYREAASFEAAIAGRLSNR